ncbi:MAG: hypothetical protein JWM16_5888 [Verrucomicrobiales bacterium]|nr:hypothetical protein [Verrucomicrobiales bacterium]
MAQRTERKFSRSQRYQYLSRGFKQLSLLEQLYHALMIRRTGVMMEPVMQLAGGAKDLKPKVKRQHQGGDSLRKTRLPSPFVGSSHFSSS